MDAVITYVDCTKRDWIDSYNKYVKTPIKEQRFRSWGTLNYQISGIRKNMPFINHIYVVVSNQNQVPYNLDDNVIVITHDMIIPKEYLPTFNSCTIEMFLHNIPNLDEEFIYFNDDMFVVDEMKDTDFFINHIPQLHVETEKYFLFDGNSVYRQQCINSTNIFKNHININNVLGQFMFLIQEHCARPLLVSTYKKVWGLCENEIKQSLTRTRHTRNVNVYIFNNYDILTNNYIDSSVHSQYFNLNEQTVNDINEYVKKPKQPLICLNDTCTHNAVSNVKKQLNIVPHKDYKIVIYTCITGNYDDLLEPKFISKNCDYICFTDNKELNSNVWNIKPMPNELSKLSFVKQQRNIKINAHKYLSEYDISIWVDSSVDLLGDINNLIDTLNFDTYNIFVGKHPHRDCIYDEAEACIKLKKDTTENINNQIQYYKNEAFPQHYGLAQTNILIRKHNDKDCIKLMHSWWKMVNRFSHRDQLSLSFCMWKLNYNKLFFLDKNIFNSTYFLWHANKHYTTNICIVHYNTPELTNCLIKSINKFVKRPCIYIFDNSDKYPFTYNYSNVTYYDNTNGKYINFDEWLNKYPSRVESHEATKEFGSAKHSISIQKCIELINDNFILLDSDVLVKRDISNLFNRNYIYVGQSEKQPNVNIYRVLPFICFINVHMLKKYNLTYFNANYMHGLHLSTVGDWYDTGGNFYRITRNMNYLEIDISKYITHYKGGSWEETHNKRIGRNLTANEWLEENKQYWEIESTH